MKPVLLALCMLLMCLATFNPAHAAFPVRHIAGATAATAENAATTITAPHEHSLPSRLRKWFQPHWQDERHKKGGMGIASLACAIAIPLFPITTIAAVVFGIIGLNKRYKNRGLALAGLILAVMELAGFVILLVLITNSLKNFTLGVI